MSRTICNGSADKSNCFDRLTPQVTDAVTKKKGMTDTICRCDNSVMSGMRRNVKTASGVSEQTYQTEPGDTIQSGKIQGKASVVGEWTLTANSMLVPYEKKMMHARNYFIMSSVDYGINMEHLVSMYVDDANHIVGCEYDEFFPV